MGPLPQGSSSTFFRVMEFLKWWSFATVLATAAKSLELVMGARYSHMFFLTSSLVMLCWEFSGKYSQIPGIASSLMYKLAFCKAWRTDGQSSER